MRKQILLAAATATAALVAAPASRQASESDPVLFARGWAGYVVRAGGRSFTRVEGSWIQPAVVCNRPGSSAAFWVGLGGATRQSQALEQIGTAVDCSERALPSHSAWYQLFPAHPVDLTLAVKPGDALSAEVQVSGRSVTVALRNLSTNESFSARVPMRRPETDSAEWIVEAPSVCFLRCSQLPLADFGRVAFTAAGTTAVDHSGTIADVSWARHKVEMGRLGGRRAAVPTPLGPEGSSFDVVQISRKLRFVLR